MYMLNIAWDFWIEFHKIAIGSQRHKPNNTDLPQLIEQVHLIHLFPITTIDD